MRKLTYIMDFDGTITFYVNNKSFEIKKSNDLYSKVIDNIKRSNHKNILTYIDKI